jgi:hypothetical protein
MPLSDDPEFLRRPIGFAVRVNKTEGLDVDEARKRLPGLLKFVRTFAGELFVQRLLDRFAAWIDTERLPQLAQEARRASKEFAAASGKLRS